MAKMPTPNLSPLFLTWRMEKEKYGEGERERGTGREWEVGGVLGG
jgi:hypothetical protein